KPNQIWPLFTDFFNFNKWLPTLATCHDVQSINGEPGCLRFRSGSSIRSNSIESTAGWSREKVVAVDHAEHVLRYEIVETPPETEDSVSEVSPPEAEDSVSEVSPPEAEDLRFNKEERQEEHSLTHSYRLTKKVRILPCGEDGEIEGCVIEWDFTVDPVGGLSLDDLVMKYEKALRIIAKNMEEALTRT
ncbi:unnamed protein product, partial [Thlaspi arvense]